MGTNGTFDGISVYRLDRHGRVQQHEVTDVQLRDPVSRREGMQWCGMGGMVGALECAVVVVWVGRSAEPLAQTVAHEGWLGGALGVQRGWLGLGCGAAQLFSSPRC